MSPVQFFLKKLHEICTHSIEHYSPGTVADSIDSIQTAKSPARTEALSLIRYFNGHFMA